MDISVQNQSPFPTGGILFRPRVNRLLDEACAHALVTVTAGTGYGKSRSVFAWLEETKPASIWLQLTALDNLPLRFWEIFTHAMGARFPSLSRRMAGMGFPDTLEKSYQFVQMLTEGIYGQQRFVLVLDDFHKIEDEAIINFVETLAFANLENMTIVLISRHPLTIDYSGLYDNSLLARITITDLRFTPAETREYYDMLGLHFTDAVLQNIQASTEGWPLAIYLIGLHRRNDGQLFNDPIACTIPLLYSLIEVEVFSAYPAEMQEIFIKLALLQSVPAELARLVSGESFVPFMELLKRNMFVYYNPYVGQYHFHRLFRLFLKQKKQQLPAEARRDIYRTAGCWYRQQDRNIEALAYFKKCDDYAGQWEIVRHFGEESYSVKMATLCIETIDAFPPEFREENPLVEVVRAQLLLTEGQVDNAHQHFLEILATYEGLTLTDARRSVLGEACIGLAHTSMILRDYRFVEYYRRAAEYLPQGSSIINETYEFVGNLNAVFLYTNEPGELEHNLKLLFEIRPTVSQLLHGCGFGSEYLAAAEGAFYTGELEKAAQYVHQAVYRAREKQQHDIICACTLLLLRISFAGGEYERCIQYIGQMREYAKTIEDTYLYGMDDIAQGWFYAQVNRPAEVPRWIMSNVLDSHLKAPISAGREKLVKGNCLMIQGKYGELLVLARYMEGFYENRGQFFSRLQVLIQKSLCLYQLGQREQALEAFDEVYRCTYNNNICMQLIEFGNWSCALLGYVLEQPDTPYDREWLLGVRRRASDYAKQRLYIMNEYEKQHAGQSRERLSLTPRETRLLEDLCQGMTREELADTHNISVNTVKTMLTHIFTKLGALNSVDAVRIAQESGLVEPRENE